MTLRRTFENAHLALQKAGVDHALIGGFALATLGVPRTTNDIDFLVHEEEKENAKKAILNSGWKLAKETSEVLHFRENGSVDILLARRPLSQKMLKNAKHLSPHGVKCVSAEAMIGLKIQAYKNDPSREFQDKADIQSLIRTHKDLDWTEIKGYADLFEEWTFIQRVKESK